MLKAASPCIPRRFFKRATSFFDLPVTEMNSLFTGRNFLRHDLRIANNIDARTNLNNLRDQTPIYSQQKKLS